MAVCAIVGMGPGIGLAVAKRFAEEGYSIAMIARGLDKLTAMAKELPTEARGYAADAADEDALRAVLTQAAAKLGRIEVLVYNASAGHAGAPSGVSADDMEADFRVNVLGALVAAQTVLPGMRAAGGGTILFTGGGLALEPAPWLASLAVGKAGIRNLAMSLSKELETENIHVATVTVCGFVQDGTHFAADKIASVYLRLHDQGRGDWEREVIYF